MNELQHQLLILILGLALSFLSLGAFDLTGRDEIRRSLVVKTMVQTGDWVIPRQRAEGKPYLSKPPQYYWHGIVASKLTGSVNEWATRLPSAFATLVIALLLYRLTLDLTSRKDTAFYASAMLLLSPMFLKHSRMATLDMTLVMFETLAITCFYFGVKQKSRPWLLGLTSISLGLAFLTKGPVAILIPMVFMLLWSWRSGRFRRACTWHLLWQIPLGIVVAAPWYVAAYNHLQAQGYDPLAFFYHETGQVLLNTYSHGQPFYYFFYQFPIGMAPWSIFFLAGIVLYRKRPELRSDAASFALWWFVPAIFFFSLSSSKQAYYILPIYPAAAMFAAIVLQECIDGHCPKLRAWSFGVWLPLCMTGLGGIIIYFSWLSSSEAYGLNGLLVPAGFIGAIAIVTALCSIVWRRKASQAMAATVAGLFVITCIANLIMLPAYASQTSVNRLSSAIQQHSQGIAEVYVFHRNISNLPFYCPLKMINLPTKEEHSEIEANLRAIGKLETDERYNALTPIELLASKHSFLIIAPKSETALLPMQQLNIVATIPKVREGNKMLGLQDIVLLRHR